MHSKPTTRLRPQPAYAPRYLTPVPPARLSPALARLCGLLALALLAGLVWWGYAS